MVVGSDSSAPAWTCTEFAQRRTNAVTLHMAASVSCGLLTSALDDLDGESQLMEGGYRVTFLVPVLGKR